jgi:hypothetical protein
LPSTINNLEVFHTEVLFIPENGTSWIDFDNGVNSVRANIQLLTDSASPQDIETRITGRDDHVFLELTNWFDFDETSLNQPSRLGTTADGRELSIFVYGKKTGPFIRIEVQFYLGELNGQQ